MSGNNLTDTVAASEVEEKLISLQDILKSLSFSKVYGQCIKCVLEWYATSVQKHKGTWTNEQQEDTKKQLEIFSQFVEELEGESKPEESDKAKLKEIQSIIEKLSTLWIPDHQTEGEVPSEEPLPSNCFTQESDPNQFSNIIQEIQLDFMKMAELKKQMDSAAKPDDSMCPTGDSESSPPLESQLRNPEEISNLLQKFIRLGSTIVNAIVEDKVECPPFLTNILQSLVVSKNMLYSTMKYFMEKYPTWMEEHKDMLTSEEYENYEEQLKVIVKVVEEFDRATESDSDDTKKQRLERISELMAQLEDLGQPPADLYYGLHAKQILFEGLNPRS